MNSAPPEREAEEAAGYRVIGPASDVRAALELLKVERPDAAKLDVNLGGERATPIAEMLQAMSVPFILATGYVAADLQAEPALRDAVNVGKSSRSGFLLKVLRDALTPGEFVSLGGGFAVIVTHTRTAKQLKHRGRAAIPGDSTMTALGSRSRHRSNDLAKTTERQLATPRVDLALPGPA